MILIRTKRRTEIFSRIMRPVLCSFLAANLLFGCITGIAQDTTRTVNYAAADHVQRDPAVMSVQTFAEVQSLSAQNRAASAVATGTNGETVYQVANLEFVSAASRRAAFPDQKTSTIRGVNTLTVFDRFADVFISDKDAFAQLARLRGLRWVEFPAVARVPPPPEVDPSTLISQAVPEPIANGGRAGLTGKNVIIAVLDTGIDFRHPDFINYDPTGRPTSRIKFLWDTSLQHRPGVGDPAPVKYPNGTSIGTLFTQDQLTAELRSESRSIPATDLDGHGTMCAGIAAGNGNADKRTGALGRSSVVGVAPSADIIGVRLGETGLENAYLVNAIAEWLDKIAGQKPVVISGSYGTHMSGHDGQTIRERQLNARFPLTRAGRALVFAAGNDGDSAIHADIAFGKEPELITWTASNDTLVSFYVDSNDPGVVVGATRATPLAKESIKFTLNPLTDQWEVTIYVQKGVGGLWINNSSGRKIKAHAYFPLGDGIFLKPAASFTHLVSSPASMANAISVGSYDWNDSFHFGLKPTVIGNVCSNEPIEIGWLSCYSSPGPNRNGTVKPEIVAPGQYFESANAKVNGETAVSDPRFPPSVDTTGEYRLMTGTSAATPYTAGVIALMFEKKPTLSLGDIRDLIMGNASKSGLNPLRRPVPNENWGYGKLDLAAVDRILASIR